MVTGHLGPTGRLQKIDDRIRCDDDPQPPALSHLAFPVLEERLAETGHDPVRNRMWIRQARIALRLRDTLIRDSLIPSSTVFDAAMFRRYIFEATAARFPTANLRL